MALREQPNQGKSNEWYTPPHIFQALGLKFDLDPCAPVGGVPWIPAKHTYCRHGLGGLGHPWYGRVWLNPPYGRETWRWLERLADHGNGIALIFARTDVARFHELAPDITALCFVRGRLRFLSPADQGYIVAGSNAAAPSVLIAFGEDNAEALKQSGLGLVVRP